MQLEEQAVRRLFAALAATIAGHADELTALDRAIGDGDHGTNMQRGFDAVLADLDRIAAKPLPEALAALGTTLVMKVGGASGPLYGTLFMQLGARHAGGARAWPPCAAAGDAALAAVKARGKSDVGAKTMLDVLAPVLAALEKAAAGDPSGLGDRLPTLADAAAEATMPDARAARPGLVPRRAQHRPHRPRRPLQRPAGRRRLPRARTAGPRHDRRRQRRHRHRLALARRRARHRRHGAPDGGRRACRSPGAAATRTAGWAPTWRRSWPAIDAAWSERGVAILFDLGGAETNSQMAVEMLPPERRGAGRGLQRAAGGGRGGRGGRGIGRRLAGGGPARGGGDVRRGRTAADAVGHGAARPMRSGCTRGPRVKLTKLANDVRRRHRAGGRPRRGRGSTPRASSR